MITHSYSPRLLLTCLRVAVDVRKWLLALPCGLALSMMVFFASDPISLDGIIVLPIAWAVFALASLGLMRSAALELTCDQRPNLRSLVAFLRFRGSAAIGLPVSFVSVLAVPLLVALPAFICVAVAIWRDDWWIALAGAPFALPSAIAALPLLMGLPLNLAHIAIHGRDGVEAVLVAARWATKAPMYFATLFGMKLTICAGLLALAMLASFGLNTLLGGYWRVSGEGSVSMPLLSWKDFVCWWLIADVAILSICVATAQDIAITLLLRHRIDGIAHTQVFDVHSVLASSSASERRLASRECKSA